MAYDEKLEMRLDELVAKRKGFSRKKMFGGIAYMLNGNMCFGIHKDKLVLRMDEESSIKALKSKYADPFDITGRPMKGWVMVSQQGLKTKDSLKSWTEMAIKFVRILPKK